MKNQTSIDFDQQAIHYTVVSELEKKYPGHDFAVFGKQLYIDDKAIPFNYSDDNYASVSTIITQIDNKVKELI